MLNLAEVDITIAGLRRHYLEHDFTPRELIAAIINKQTLYQDNPIWITALSPAQLDVYLQKLDAISPEALPLYGIPFAIKDNIDLAGVTTTAACPDFSYTPTENAYVVQQLLNAGALPLGKTNMDQFATGLVGTRSPEPWGPCKNALNPEIISGGSSSGSAVAVALGLVSFALGTDTAGSGRVPAALNNIVGLKPTRGLLSNRGVVPACKSLDCVSIFALTADDANTVFDVAASYDAVDSYSRANPHKNSKRYYGNVQSPLSIGVPLDADLDFLGDANTKSLFQHARERISAFAELKPINFIPFKAAAKLLYEGPWLSERKIAIEDVDSKSLLPVIKSIIREGKSDSAETGFRSQYQLAQYKREADIILSTVDAIVSPTIATSYTINAVLNDPIQLNSNLGIYTNFMNLLDYAAVSIPVGFFDAGVGFGVTIFSHAFTDKQLLSIARQFQIAKPMTMGALPQTFLPGNIETLVPSNFVDVVVCGAHLQGLPLNWQLTERGAFRIKSTTTSPHYRFYALAGGPPKRPGLIRDVDKGGPIAVEVWRVPKENFGSFVAEIPHPLGIGKVELADGTWCSGFICEPGGAKGAEDITHLGDWKKFIGLKKP